MVTLFESHLGRSDIGEKNNIMKISINDSLTSVKHTSGTLQVERFKVIKKEN